MRTRTLVLTAACGAALLGPAALPATATGPGAGGTGSAHRRAVSGAAAPAGPVTASALLAGTTSCTRISRGSYRTDAHRPKATVPVCGTTDAVFWKADMDIDCDGRKTEACNRKTDPYFLPETAFRTSRGKPLDSAALPYVVVPAPGSVWDYRRSGISGGSVVAVVHRDRVRYAVVGDTGPSGVIGEASYATAEALGIDPDPRTGGTDSGVTYLVFRNSRVSPIESRTKATAEGEALARMFLDRG
ncbi:glycoside hydrolase family 75 protein [Streptomyces sp. NPDC001787]|uniref:glycoside hydrolase family 75 protein n=1 Tax=Streptomyces sp. NPDC001787 TaxID=3154523 RepID=UPI0033216812